MHLTFSTANVPTIPLLTGKDSSGGGRAKTALIPRNFGVVLTKIKFKIGDKTYFEGNVNMGEFFEINADRDAFDG
jgi:hypothetical protein